MTTFDVRVATLLPWRSVSDDTSYGTASPRFISACSPSRPQKLYVVWLNAGFGAESYMSRPGTRPSGGGLACTPPARALLRAAGDACRAASLVLLRVAVGIQACEDVHICVMCVGSRFAIALRLWLWLPPAHRVWRVRRRRVIYRRSGPCRSTVLPRAMTTYTYIHTAHSIPPPSGW